MKSFPFAVMTILISVGLCILVTVLMTNNPGSGIEAVDLLSKRVDDLDLTIEKLSSENAKLVEQVKNNQIKGTASQSGRAKISLESVDEAVGEWFQKHRPDLLPGKKSGHGARARELVRVEEARAFLARLRDPEIDDTKWNEIWKKISKAGLIDHALTLLEAAAAESPDSAAAHFELAGGYFGKSINTSNDIEKGVFAVKADQALDRVLKIDPRHWDARFTKASSLSYYPPAMGKQGEAIKQFEILRDQQRQIPANSKHVQTYIALGNLYGQLGNYAKAREIWNEGLGLHPGSKELRKQLDNSMKD